MVSVSFFRGIGALALACACSSAIAAPQGATPDSGIPAADVPDARVFLPPPPADGTAAKADDDRVFQLSQTLIGSPRWKLAASDADLHPEHIVASFSCAVGHVLDLKAAPHLDAVFDRLAPVVAHETQDVKVFYHRERPFVATSAPVCAPVGKGAYYISYPSGHTTDEFSIALILARLMPTHASAIIQRGRVFGESRAVCGVHWKSDVEGGYLNAAALMNALLDEPVLQADLAAAKQELAAQLASNPAPDAAGCAVEADAARNSIFTKP